MINSQQGLLQQQSLQQQGKLKEDKNSTVGERSSVLDSGASPANHDLVCLSHLRWNFVYQRPQHLLSRCVQERRVFFFEEPIWDDSTEATLAVNQDESGVWVAVPHLPKGTPHEKAIMLQQKLLDSLLSQYQIEAPVLWYYTPMSLAFSRHIQSSAIVFDCMDELSAFAGASPELKRFEAELLEKADVVFTGGQSLYEAKRDKHNNAHAFPSSVDVQHFAQAKSVTEEPTDQAAIPHPRLGFFGVIDERMDLDLLKDMAEARPDWQLVVIGPVVKISEDSLPKLPNIHYLGGKSYQELPNYLAGWNVALLPFAMNDSTKFISPTKTPEYLAAGCCVVSTPITDVIRPYGDLDLVRIAGTSDEFIRACDDALAENPVETGRQERIDQFISQLSWDSTWNGMSILITLAVRSKVTPLPKPGDGRDHHRGDSSRDGHRRRVGKSNGFDYLVVGAGFAGSVIAERLARDANKRVLIVDKRPHIGGNAYDHYDDHGILVHRYGPHIFHTNSQDVFEYLSRFTQWHQYEHRVLASVDGKLVPIPINLDTLNAIYDMNLQTEEEAEAFLASKAEPCETIRTSEDVVISKVGRELYEKFFRGYTRKQWGMDPSELDATVTARVPTRTNRDDRYFNDKFQAMPLHGFTRMFENMLDHPNIKIMLNTDYREIIDTIPYGEMIYTGPVDAFFNYQYGKLPYRSLEFKHETLDVDNVQPVSVVNYPNEHEYTRVTEFKQLTGQEHRKTSIVYEYPRAEGDPYYPVPKPENTERYNKYKTLADATPGVYFIGRLATYKYYNMDQVVAQALATYKQIKERLHVGQVAALF